MRNHHKKVGLLGVLLLAHILLAGSAMAQVVSFAALKPGSLFHTMATTIAKVVTEKSNIRMLVQPYGSGAAGMAAVNQGDAAFVFADANDAITAVAGTHFFKGRPTPNLRIAANSRAVPVGLFVRKNSGIRTMADFKGKRLPAKYVAFPNGIALLNGILAASNMKWSDVVEVPTPHLIPAVDDFIAGKMDAGFFAIGTPKVAQADHAVGGIRFIPVPNDAAALRRARTVRPAYYFINIKPLPHLKGIEVPTTLLTFDQVIGVGNHVPDKVVYTVLKVLAENKAALVKGFRPFVTFFPKRMGKQFKGVEHHPGAIRLLKEKGYWPGG